MKKVKWKRVGYFGAVIGLLVFFHYLNLLDPLESRLQRLANPALARLHGFAAGASRLYSQQTDRRDLQTVVAELEGQVNRLLEENANLKSLEEENERLRGFLDFAAPAPYRRLMLNVVGKSDLGQANQSITLDRGSQDGLRPGLAIVSQDGIIVGKITKTKEHSAEACLVTSNDCQFAAAIQNQDRTVGLVRGDLGLTVKMELIPQSEQIKSGMTVVSSGLEQSVPRGLVIGRVEEAVRENNELWQAARIASLAKLDNLSIVAALVP